MGHSEFRCPCGTVVTGSEQLVQSAVEDHMCTSTQGEWSSVVWIAICTLPTLALLAYNTWGR